ncbi:MAG: DUF975 family protein [Lachnospiraceae bacterium]|nr:DUF975 family protein [Lachnospiraceae bacterium]
MWTRKELKSKAKQRCSANYWKCVLVALLMALLGGGAGFGSGGTYSEVRDTIGDMFDDHNDEAFDDGWSDGFEEMPGDYDVNLDTFLDDVSGTNPVQAAITTTAVFAFAMMILFVVIVVGLVIAIPLCVFFLNPLEVGLKRFFVQNLRDRANVKEICYAFDRNYMNCVKVLFFRDLYIFLWALLFLIPGIIKAYEFRMVPYILGENPDITKEQAFALSGEMMLGNKGKAFLLDLSFLGWYILSGLTLGLLGIFYVNPYVNQTDAALYQKLKGLPPLSQQPEGTAYQE